MSEKTREGQDFDKPYMGTAGAPAAERTALKSNDRRAHQKAITQGLRKFFDSVASEPVPDEFLEILKKMDDGKGGGQ